MLKRYDEKNKEYHRQYYIKNREKILRQTKEYNKKNKEKIAKQKRAYNKRTKKYHSDFMKKYYIADRENFLRRNRGNYKKNKESILTRHKKYLQTKEGRAADQRNKFRKRKARENIINNLTAQEWADILEQYNYVCAYCGVEFNCELPPTKDHIMPTSKGGHNVKENVVPACRSCNSKKHNNILGEINDNITLY